MMEQLPSGLTWAEIKEKFADSNLSITLNYVNRRAKKSLRNNGETESRKLWRLFVQNFDGDQITTVFKKNIRVGEDNLLEQKASDKLVGQINNVIAQF
ncbi:hypothetical protein [Lentisphaera araneosa]|jgi:hypothetical protein|nr:hypothetical protein [Lentisphaera araneosa]